MKPTLLLIDTHPRYAARLAARLNHLAGGAYRASTLAPGAPWPARKEDLPPDTCLAILPEACADWPLFAGEPFPLLFWGQASEGEDRVPRFSGAGEIDRMVRLHLNPVNPAAQGTQGERTCGCHLSFSQDRARAINRHVLDQALASGKRLIYLPVKPLYRLEDSFRSSPGMTAGDLLCLLASGQRPQASEVGRWLYLHERGYFTFRLPDRADDLVSCEIEVLRQLVSLTHDYARESTEATQVWLDTEGLLLDRHLRLAALCDHLYVDIPQGDSAAAYSARRELGILLAGLPPSCAVLEQILPGGS